MPEIRSEAIGGQAFADRANHRDAAGHGRFEAEMDAALRGEPQQRAAFVRHQLLVGGHHRFARVERLLDPRARRLESADQLDDDVDFGREEVFEPLGPTDIGRDPVDAFARDVPVADVGEPKRMGARP